MKTITTQEMNNSKKIFLPIIWMFFIMLLGPAIHGQTNINGNVLDDNGESLAFANVLLVKAADSTLEKGVITQENGTFLIENVPEGRYKITASMIGFASKTTEPFEVQSGSPLNFPTISLTGGLALDEVVVQSTKPLYVQKIDRMVINVSNSIVSAGSSALEVLARSPGVTVNMQSGIISLIGKNGVSIMINGKLSYMPAAGIIQMLQGMNSDNIETIELITTPPANLDAEGNAGYINIVLKKQTDVGLNGSFSISAGVGNGNTTSDNINLNYRKNKINIYGSYSFLRQEQGQTFIFERSLIDENNSKVDLSTVSNRDPIQRNHNLLLGLDYELSPKTQIGFIISAYDTKWTMDASNNSIGTINQIPDSIVNIYSQERNQWQNFSSNINLKHTFNEGESLSFDFDYLYYYDENPTDYTYSFFDGNQNFIREELIQSDKTTPIKFIVAKTDYSKQINEIWKLESGIKGVFSNFRNDILISNFDGINYIPDPTLSDNSYLDESILAAYTSVNYKISDKTDLKVGLRYEQTDTELATETDGKVVDRNYGELFPTIYVSHMVNDSLSFNLSYSRRITRPTFTDMAPFVIFIDPTTFLSGNPAIQPSISNAVKFDTNYRTLYLSAQYTLENDIIAGFQPYFDTVNDRLVYEATNLDKGSTFSLTLGLPITVANWWNMQNNIIYLYNQIKNQGNDLDFNYHQNTINVNSTQSFTMAKNLTSELNLNFYGPALSGIYQTNSVFFMNFGIQKKFNKNDASLKFAVTDVFDSLKFKAYSEVPEQNLDVNASLDFSNRTFSLTYSQNFGNSKLKAANKRGTGAEEEKRRVQ